MTSSFLQNTWPFQLAILFSIFVGRAVVFAGGSTIWIGLSEWARKRRIVEPKEPGETLLVQIAYGVIILLIDAATVIGAVQIGWLRVYEGSSAAQILAIFTGMFVWLEIYFYYSHRALHHPKLFWIHRHHHRAKATNPWTSLSFSFAERFVLLAGAVGAPALFSQLVPFSMEGYSLYFAVNYALNVYGHINVEIAPPAFVRSPVGKVVNVTTYHALHHLRYRGHFGLFTSTLDRLHGTKFADYEEAHAKAARHPACPPLLPVKLANERFFARMPRERKIDQPREQLLITDP